MPAPSKELKYHRRNEDHEGAGRDKYLPEILLVFW
jgi:hypothetical protein